MPEKCCTQVSQEPKNSANIEHLFQMRPLRIERNSGNGVRIRWSNNTLHSISSRVLRDHCPSAVSRAKRGETGHEKPLTTGRSSLLRVVEHTTTEELNLVSIWSVGRYALGMRWGDGHDTGIYPYTLLHELGELERLSSKPAETTVSVPETSNAA